MMKFDLQDWAYAHAYQSMAAEQDLPHAIQVKRAKSLISFYRQQIRHLIFHYRLWLADAEYMRITGQAKTARSNPVFIATLRRALGQYRQQYATLRDLCRIQQASRKPNSRPDFSIMSEQEIYDYLELTHGLYFAQQVVDEMQKAKRRTTPKAA